jgi:hypothetical protein
MVGGQYGDPRWSNPDLDPIPPEKRTWGGLDYCRYQSIDIIFDVQAYENLKGPTGAVICLHLLSQALYRV